MLALMLLISLADPQAFEVASVKVNKGPGPVPAGNGSGPPPVPGPIKASPDGVTGSYQTLIDCLTWAYGVRRWQVSGPAWIKGDHYDISARGAAPASVDQLKVMLQALLVDRFRMNLRREKKDTAVMALVVGPGGPKLHPSAAGVQENMQFDFSGGVFHWTFQNTSLDMLENLLFSPDWDPVVNQTGLAGGFDFSFERLARDAELGDIQATLQSRLGLRLERRRMPVEMLVIEKADRVPTEN